MYSVCTLYEIYYVQLTKIMNNVRNLLLKVDFKPLTQKTSCENLFGLEAKFQMQNLNLEKFSSFLISLHDCLINYIVLFHINRVTYCVFSYVFLIHSFKAYSLTDCDYYLYSLFQFSHHSQSESFSISVVNITLQGKWKWSQQA